MSRKSKIIPTIFNLRFFLAFTLTITNMSSGITEVCFGISVAYRKLDSEHMLRFEVSDVTLTAR